MKQQKPKTTKITLTGPQPVIAAEVETKPASPATSRYKPLGCYLCEGTVNRNHEGYGGLKCNQCESEWSNFKWFKKERAELQQELDQLNTPRQILIQQIKIMNDSDLATLDCLITIINNASPKELDYLHNLTTNGPKFWQAINP